MFRRPPSTTLTDSLFPFTTLFRSDDVAPYEIIGADGERRGDEPRRPHGAGRGDLDAVGVDEEDLPIGIQRPRDGRGRIAGHAVEQGRARIGLADIDATTLADREALPVDDGAVARQIGRAHV